MIEVIGISGSLRRKSYNTLLLHTAMELAPEGMLIAPASIDLPLYNEDLHEQGDPAEVMVGGVMGVFDDNGKMTDHATREHVAKQLVAFAALVDEKTR